MEFPEEVISSTFVKRSVVVNAVPKVNAAFAVNHNKYFVVINVSGGSVHYCVINSKAWRGSANPSQVMVTPEDLPSLCKPVSYVNCANVFSEKLDSFSKKVSEHSYDFMGEISPSAMSKILEAGRNCVELSKKKKDLFL